MRLRKVGAALVLASGLLLGLGCGEGGGGDDPLGLPDRFVVLTADKQAIASDGSEAAELTVTVVQFSGDVFVTGAEVRLTTDRGVFLETGTRSQTVTTTLIPTPSASLIGDGSNGTARVTGSYRGASGFVEIILR